MILTDLFSQKLGVVVVDSEEEPYDNSIDALESRNLNYASSSTIWQGPSIMPAHVTQGGKIRTKDIANKGQICMRKKMGGAS